MPQFYEDDIHVIHGPPTTRPLSYESLGVEILETLQKLSENAIAMIDIFTEQKITYSELLQKSINLAVALEMLNCTGQDTVLSISSENSLHFFVPVLASLFNLSIMAPINHMYTIYEMEHVLNISRPKVVFCSRELLGKFQYLKKKLEFIEYIIVLESSTTATAVENMDELINRVLQGRKITAKQFRAANGMADKLIALILCSSGTTGLPKGVAVSHLGIQVNLNRFNDQQYEEIQSEQRKITQQNVLGLIPFFHAYGCLLTLSNLVKGNVIVCMKKFEEDIFLRAIQNYKIEVLFLAPPLVVFLAKSDKVLQYDLSGVKSILCGAAPLSKGTEEEAIRRLKNAKFRQGYGLTEMTLVVTMFKVDEYRPGSCGKMAAACSGKVMDMETGRSLKPNQPGELCFSGPGVMIGYYKNQKATEESFTPNGWLRTGDIGYYDNDGYFFIVDRLKELIKFKGFQIAPAELEALLIKNPKINDVGVVGLPDESVGERPMAFVVKQPNANISEQEIQKYVADFMSPQKRLSGGVIFIDSIPKNPSGKILRRKLRELLEKMAKSKL
ncbi:hypothetical protein ABEB36_013459 [Hypothenemus hampei]|uniref:Luciferin 4-monooxygenase n=1 Tax=Hypothenemus hampei TaxID=57062 RepID=A0ABD1E850_HYPHA